MKKKAIALVISTLMLTGLVGCGDSTSGTSNGGEEVTVGMVTDAGTIDDKSFNQGTWEGIEIAKEKLGVSTKYLKPAGTTEADYLTEITNLIEGDFNMIIAPGYKFETAIMKAQDQYADTKFVIIDGSPNNGKEGEEFASKVGENTVAIYFAEEQSGFLAGVAAALELKDGDLGFIGGMEIPAVQKFNWGFQQGVKYANENLGTKMNIAEENVVYEGSFDNVAGGQQIAAQMYERGVKAIFTAAGGVGAGAINEAKTRAKNGEEVWVIGVDVNQYEDGIYDEASNKSAILTSATKKLDQVGYEMVKAAVEGNFPGGQALTFDAANNGIGLPNENPNLSEDNGLSMYFITNLTTDGYNFKSKFCSLFYKYYRMLMTLSKYNRAYSFLLNCLEECDYVGDIQGAMFCMMKMIKLYDMLNTYSDREKMVHIDCLRRLGLFNQTKTSVEKVVLSEEYLKDVTISQVLEYQTYLAENYKDGLYTFKDMRKWVEEKNC